MHGTPGALATPVKQVGERAAEAVSSLSRALRASALRWLEIMKLVPTAGPRLVAFSALVNLTIGLLPVGFMVGTSVMVQRLPALAAVAAGNHREWGPVLVALALSVGALVLQNLLAPTQPALGELVARRVDSKVTRRLMTVALTRAPMEVLDSKDVLDKLTEARQGLLEGSATPGCAVAGVLALVARYAQLLAAVAVAVLVLGPGWAAVVCACALVPRFGNRGSFTRWSLVSRWDWGVKRKLRYIYDSGTDVAFSKEVRLFGMLGWWAARARAESKAFHQRMWRERRQIYFTPFLFLTALVLAGTLAALLALRAAAIAGRLDVLRFVLGLQVVLVASRFGVFFPEADVKTCYGMVAWDALRELEERFSSGGRVHDKGTKSAEGLPRRCVRFEGVSFAYPGSERLVLDGLDLELAEGTSTAVVGFNGAGKTTLVRLLARLYRPDKGRVTVDGTDVAELDARSWQRRLAVIFQDFVRYELDAGTNIALGAPGGSATFDGVAVEKAAALAGATGVLASLPSGLSTPLSSRYAGGVDLSGGQWQRIALARAMYAVGAGASVLVLDEPTAQLDVRAEVAFFDNFLDLTRGLTTLVISHRFSTVRRAQRIVVLDKGKVTEQGTHEELMAMGGRYAELFELQARRFEAGEEEPQEEADDGVLDVVVATGGRP
jgi:ATP-binding cassette subfamily B protein